MYLRKFVTKKETKFSKHWLVTHRHLLATLKVAQL